jgi:integrase
MGGVAGAVRSEKVTVAALLDELLADYEVNGKSVEWARYVDKHLRPVFGQMKATAVGTAAIAQYIAERRRNSIANATINRELSLLRRAFHLGKDADPPLVSRVPRIPKLEENNVRKGFFDHSHFVALRSELPEHLRPVITFAYYTGCRKGEILGLRWLQVDLSNRVVRLEPGETKNDEARTIPLMGELYHMLVLQNQKRDQLWPACKWVFCRHGKRILNFYAAWEQASKRAGLVDDSGDPARLFHDLRRTGIRNLIRAGVPERVAMAISGHKTRSVLDRYNIVDERDLRQAADKLQAFIQSQSAADKDKSKDKLPSEAHPEENTKTESKLLN